MSQKTSILLLILLSSFSFFAFRSAAKSAKMNPVDTRSQNLIDTGGRTVSLDSAQACINRYIALMKDHGFANQAGQSINIHLKKTTKITTGESFNGQNLLNWLSATNTEYTAAGKTLMVRIQLGVYDANYLNTYQPDPALRAANKNRVAIFIIPYDAASGQAFRALDALPAGSSGGGGTGYDLGGIQP